MSQEFLMGGGFIAGGPQLPAAAPVAAFNGTSIDPVTGNVMLGDFTSDAVNGPSKLTEITSIPINGWILDFLSSYQLGGTHQKVRIDDEGVTLNGRYGFPTNRNAGITFREDSGGDPHTRFYETTDRLLIEMGNNSNVLSALELLQTGQVIYRGLTFTGSAPEADVTIYGSMSFRTVFSAPGANVGAGGNGNFSISNQGSGAPMAVDISGSSPNGCRITFHVFEAQTLSISGTNDIIRVGALTTVIGGSVSSNVVGSCITIECINSGVTNPIWNTVSFTGNWTI
jgi:hypothetical protein